MSSTIHRLLLAALAITALGGCASLPKSACQSGAWYDIGLRDGSSGHTEDRFLDHAQACVRHGLPADRDQWMLGRARGLDRYCTVRNGLAVGENNSRYGGVCPAEREDEFLRGYDVGRDLHAARGELASIEGEMQRIRARLAPPDDKSGDADRKSPDEKPLTDKERLALAYQLGMLTVQRETARRQLGDIELVARSF